MVFKKQQGYLTRGGRGIVFCLAALWSLVSFSIESVASEQEPLKVVTTFSILADMVSQVGGEYVNVHTLVGWDEDAHVFQPSPDDVKHIARADLLVLNGLGFEGWLERLVLAASYAGPSVVASEGVALIPLNLGKISDRHNRHDHKVHKSHQGNIYDPHAWHSLTAAKMYVENIAKALIKIQPAYSESVLKNKRAYIEALNVLDLSIKSQLMAIPDSHKRIVVPHNAFAYFEKDYGVHIYGLQGVSTESEASAADLARLVGLIKGRNIQAIFTENISDQRLIRVVESETDAAIHGALVSGALSRKLAPSYIDMMRHNSELIIESLTKN